MKRFNSFDYVRNTYGVPARRGGRVRTSMGEGTITKADQYVWVKIDGAKFSEPWHPTDVEYIESEGA